MRVRLEAHPYSDDGGLARENEQAVAALHDCGADARLVDHGTAKNHPALHLKAAVCDGVAYLDDRNWAGKGEETIVRDDFGADARAVRDAIRSDSGSSNAFFATRKDAAIREEAALIRSARPGETLDVQSESFSPSVVSKQLLQAARRGVKCRLQVARRDVKPREASELKNLAKAGIEVRIGDSDEKMAVLNGTRAWVGSANASSVHDIGGQLDWGLRADTPGVVRALRAHFNASWSAGSSLSSLSN